VAGLGQEPSVPPPLTTGDDLRARNRRRGPLVYLVSSCIDVFPLVVAAFHVVTVIIRGPRGLRRRSTARRLSLLGVPPVDVPTEF
jgi:hypothetical protein